MKNHQIVNGQLVQMNKKFSQLKEHQKSRIAEWLYEKYREVCVEQKRSPNREEDAQIIVAVMDKIIEAEIWIPKHEVEMYYKGRKLRYAKRFEAECNAR